jgi:hypothetical protein
MRYDQSPMAWCLKFESYANASQSCGEEEEACDEYNQMLQPKFGRAKPVFHIEYVERSPISTGAVAGAGPTAWSISTAWGQNATAEEIRKKLCVKDKPKLSTKMSTVIKVRFICASLLRCRKANNFGN